MYILYHQLWRSQPSKLMLEPVSQLLSVKPAHLYPQQQLSKSKHSPINPSDDLADGVSPPLDSLEAD